VRNWRTSRPTAALLIALFLIIQLTLPISRLGDDSAKRFGWQMFSKSSTPPGFVVRMNDGAEVEISLDDYTAILRADIALIDRMPPHLCAIMPDALSVTWQTGEFQC
jgi:hypothetical protein